MFEVEYSILSVYVAENASGGSNPVSKTHVAIRHLEISFQISSILITYLNACTNLLSLLQALARNLAPLADRVLVRRAAKEAQTSGGIYIPTATVKTANEGEVVAVGPGMRDVNGNLHPPSLKPGDKVLLAEYGGVTVKLDGDEMFLIREDDILGKFE